MERKGGVEVGRKSLRFFLLLATALLVLVAAGCGGDDDGGEGGEAQTGGTLVFAGAADPVVLDGALVSDGESIRVITQIFETLINLKPGTTELEPGLATEWEVSPDAMTYTFSLREGVKFHDGTDFNAEAVCFNFDRWYNFKGPLQSPSASYYYSAFFGGFKNNAVQELRGAQPDDRGRHAEPAVGVAPRRARPAGVLDREPAGTRAVQRRPGHAGRGDRLPPDRDVRHGAPDRDRPVRVRLLDA
jgi:ABC-type oligopeptide transport system substrate-binding subunit